MHQDTKENLMFDLDHLAKSPVPVVVTPSTGLHGLHPRTPQKMPDFQRRLVMHHDLPSNWIIKRGQKIDFQTKIVDSFYSEGGSAQYISPDGEVFDNIESVIERTRYEKNHSNNTPKKRKDSILPQNSSVIRKLPSLSPPKKARLDEDDIVDLLLDSDSES